MPPKKVTKKQSSHGNELPFTQTNYLIFGAALLFIIAGFVIMEGNEITLSPILLVIGYVFLLPASVIWHSKTKDDAAPTTDATLPVDE